MKMPSDYSFPLGTRSLTPAIASARLKRIPATGISLVGYPPAAEVAGTSTVWIHHHESADIRRLEKTVVLLAQRIEELEAGSRSRMVALSSLGHPRYRLKRDLFVEIDSSGSAVTAHSIELEEYGSGETEYEALASLRHALCETFDFLGTNQNQLGPDLEAQLARFNDLVETK
jgi:hypothetical protein